MSKLLMQRVTWRVMALIGFESVLILSAVLLGTYLRLGARPFEQSASHLALKGLLIAGVCQLCLYYGDLYNSRIGGDRRELYVRTLRALGATSLVLAALYFWLPDLIIGRGVFMIAATLVIVSVVGWRMSFQWFAKQVGPRERLLLVGTSPAALSLARDLEERHNLGVEVVGFVDIHQARDSRPVPSSRVVGTIDDIPEIVASRSVDRVVVNLSDARGQLPMDTLLSMKLQGVTFDHLASVYEEYTGKIAVENLRPSWLIFSPGFRKPKSLVAMKRAIDIGAASVGMVLAAPLMLGVATLIKLVSRGPALYRQQRVGEHGQVFTLYKFRSMRTDAEDKTGPVWARDADDRIIPGGGFIRKTRLDELPQLWNVLRGNMSLVGPRPERPEFVGELTRAIPFYGQRHVVKPGVTGWAQVRYAYGASVDDSMEKLQYDLFYIKNLTIALDLFIVFLTVKTVILRRGAK
ncbi:MAG: TIGR03013 family PEP-CTERM/XrtA system glycosyltransferase [Acidobacteria bacterium]|nr:MAG: TIGR03013 family PEP-CTERM/XrtA system glycosyltransferase [Acidobacteriota bacterium]